MQVEQCHSFLWWLLLEKDIVISLETGDGVILQHHRLTAKDLEASFQITNMLLSFLLMRRECFPGLSVGRLLGQLWQHLDQFLLDVIHGTEIVEKEISWTLYRHYSFS